MPSVLVKFLPYPSSKEDTRKCRVLDRMTCHSDWCAKATAFVRKNGLHAYLIVRSIPSQSSCLSPRTGYHQVRQTPSGLFVPVQKHVVTSPAGSLTGGILESWAVSLTIMGAVNCIPNVSGPCSACWSNCPYAHSTRISICRRINADHVAPMSVHGYHGKWRDVATLTRIALTAPCISGRSHLEMGSSNRLS